MLARSSRSTSKTEETTTRKPTNLRSFKALALTANHLSSTPLLATLTPSSNENNPRSDTNMISIARELMESNPPIGVFDDTTADAEGDMDSVHSSSLSELEDDDLSDVQPESLSGGRYSKITDIDVDSEAETERLDKSPLKQNVSALGAPSQITPTPEQTIVTGDVRKSSSPSPEGLEIDAVSMLSQSDNRASLGKRKRLSDSLASPVLDDLDEPSPKRVLMDDLQLDRTFDHFEEEKDQAEDETDGEVAVAEEDGVISDEIDEPIATEPEPDAPLIVEKKTRGRKGKRKYGKAALVEIGAPAEASDTPAVEPEAVDEEVEDEEEQSHDEEQAKRKVAATVLADIEKEFIAFRERHVEEQIEQVEYEINMLRVRKCNHPDYLAQLKCIDDRRDQKILYENRLLGFNLENLTTRTVNERQQHLSQFVQTTRQIRDDGIKGCYRELYSLQRDRWRFGSAAKASLPLYDPKREDQLLRQTAYNKEVSLLSGIAKFVGFPSAPDMSTLASTDIATDFHAMGINIPRAVPVPRTHSFLDKTAAEEQFYEQTPWANPSHPAHATAMVQSFHTQTAPIQFITPALQNRHVDIGALGSASTIEMQSNPQSSAIAPPQYRVEHESPTLTRLSKPMYGNVDRLASASSTMYDPGEGIPKAQQENETDFTTKSTPFNRRNYMTSTSPPSINRGLGQEILGPTPQRVIAAPIANSTGRFAS